MGDETQNDVSNGANADRKQSRRDVIRVGLGAPAF